MVAAAALFLGLVRAVADLDPPVEDVPDFRFAAQDLQAAALLGLGSRLHWHGRSGVQTYDARRLLLETLIPLAAWGVHPDDAEHYLGVVEGRVSSGRTGAVWQATTVEELETHGADREAALREMVRRYVENARTHQPVHFWL